MNRFLERIKQANVRRDFLIDIFKGVKAKVKSYNHKDIATPVVDSEKSTTDADAVLDNAPGTNR